VLGFGILGAARIAPPGLVQPCRELPKVEVVAVGARDPVRAERFVHDQGIGAVACDYEELVQLPEVDAVYNALPNSLHAPWTLVALRAGKHVLCEKPMASNAEEAEGMVAYAAERGLVLAEAFHYRYHPLFARVLALCASGVLGPLRRVEGRFTAPIVEPDIRYELALAGGATMDLGCYVIHWLRHVVGFEPEVTSARAEQGPPGVDVEMTADLLFPEDVEGRIHCAMGANVPFEAQLTLHGTRGELDVRNPLAPQLGHELRLRDERGERVETAEGASTYHHQLQAFTQAVRAGRPLPTGGEDAVENMRTIDAVYTAAGLPLRGN
jgi:predicted dehydrogenase